MDTRIREIEHQLNMLRARTGALRHVKRALGLILQEIKDINVYLGGEYEDDDMEVDDEPEDTKGDDE